MHIAVKTISNGFIVRGLTASGHEIEIYAADKENVSRAVLGFIDWSQDDTIEFADSVDKVLKDK